jgi:hypothetical protein
MKLRGGVEFNDDTTLNASSLKYQVEWTLDKKTEPGPGDGFYRSSRSK